MIYYFFRIDIDDTYSKKKPPCFVKLISIRLRELENPPHGWRKEHPQVRALIHVNSRVSIHLCLKIR